MSFPITRQRRLFCLFAYRGILIHHSVGILSCYPLWHVPSGSNSSFLLLCGMSSQQDITPKKNMSGIPRIGFPFFLAPAHTISYFWPMTHHSCIGWVQVGSAWALRVLHFSCTSKACLLLMPLPWSGLSSVYSVAHPWPLMAWTVLWFSLIYWLASFKV